MRFLARLATGDIALWRVFWLIGTPLSILWDVTGACMVTGYGVQEPVIAGSVIGLFTLSSIAIIFVSFAIWRSASNYPREAWWKWPLAIGAKLSATFSGLAAAASFLAVLYFGSLFIYARIAEF